VTPGFFEDYLNAENVLLRPYGAGESIAFNFAYNLLTLKFMKASQQLTNDRLAKSLDSLNIGKVVCCFFIYLCIGKVVCCWFFFISILVKLFVGLFLKPSLLQSF
jgi:hypothetical protein